MPGHTKHDVTNFWVARIPGCERLWSESKTVHRHCSGISGCWDPVDTSQRSGPVELGSGIDSTTSGDDGAGCRDWICKSAAWALAIAAKSKTGGWLLIRALVSMHKRASATTLSVLWMCLIVNVNWEMKSNCRAWWGECLDEPVEQRWEACGQSAHEIHALRENAESAKWRATYSQMYCNAFLQVSSSSKRKKSDALCHQYTVAEQLRQQHRIHPSSNR